MALDLYEFCPGGTEQKIKFCPCSKDSFDDLEKVHEAIRGGQRAAALSLLSRLLETKGKRPCFLALKGVVQLELEDTDGYIATADAFRAEHPQNSAALAMAAVAAGCRGNLAEAIQFLQQSLERTEQNIHVNLYYAIGFVADLCLNNGFVLAARGHGTLQMVLAPEGDRRPVERQLTIVQSPQVPVLLKEPLALQPCAADAPYRAEFEAALQAVNRGRWAQGLALLQPLAERYPTEPVLWQDAAILHGWLAHETEAAAAWRRFAALDGVPFDEAVRAEALGQVLASVAADDMVLEVRQTYPVSDSERVMERLLSEKRLTPMNIDLSALANDESPPPKGAFWLLDRPMPATGKGLTADQVPSVVGELYLFGKETDRDARLEFIVSRTRDVEQKAATVQQLLGEYGGPAHKEEPTGESASAAALALTWRWRLPGDVSPTDQQALVEAKRRDVNLNVWPKTPLSELDGKTPEEAAADPAYRVRLAAAILLLELSSEQTFGAFDFCELQAKLGLPQRNDFQPGTVEVRRISLLDLHRLDPAPMDDEVLRVAYTRAVTHGLVRATRRLGTAVLQRPAVCKQLGRAEVCGVLASKALDTEAALAYYQQAYQAAVADKQPAGRWLVQEMYLRAARGQAQEFGAAMTRLQTNHMGEPGVEQLLYQLLVRIGAIRPDGTPAFTPEAMAGVPAAPPEPAAAPSGLWTPGSPAPGGSSDRPKLWVPGQS